MNEKRKRSGEKDPVKKKNQTKKYLDMVTEGKLKNPPPSFKAKISAKLGLKKLPKDE